MDTLEDDRNLVNFTADAIPWQSRPPSRIEATDLLALDSDETLAYATELQVETEALRALLHQALTALNAANLQRDRSLQRIDALVTELKRARADVRVLATQVRAFQAAA